MNYGISVNNTSGFTQIDSMYKNLFYDRTIPVDFMSNYNFPPYETVFYVTPNNWEYATSAIVTKPRPSVITSSDYGFIVYSDIGEIVYDYRARPLDIKSTFILPGGYLGEANLSLPAPKPNKVRCFGITMGFGGEVGYEQYVYAFMQYYYASVLVNTTINPSNGYWNMRWFFDSIDFPALRVLVLDI